MTIYTVLRRVSFAGGAAVVEPVASFTDKDEAARESQRLGKLVAGALEEPFAGGHVKDFLAALGLEAIQHDVAAIRVKDTLITVPKVSLQ